MKRAALFVGMASSMLLAACGSFEPNVYSLSMEQARAALAGAKSQYGDGKSTRYFQAQGWNGSSFSVLLSNKGSFKKTCKLNFEAVSDTQTKITPSCGESQSAIGGVPIKFLELEMAEHVKHILTGKPIDVQALKMKSTAVMAKNLPAMQGEALAMDRQMRAQRDARRQSSSGFSSNSDDGWGSEAGGDHSDGGWGVE